MLLSALLLFTAVACVGLYMAVKLTRAGFVSPRLAAAHGLAGLCAIFLLIAGIFLVPHPLVVNDALFMFVVAAVGGIFMFSLKRGGRLPWPVAYVHGLAAIVAVGLLAAGLIFV